MVGRRDALLFTLFTIDIPLLHYGPHAHGSNNSITLDQLSVAGIVSTPRILERGSRSDLFLGGVIQDMSNLRVHVPTRPRKRGEL